MKNITRLLLFLIVSGAALAQSSVSDFDRIVEAEMKSGYHIKNFNAGGNTGNYDVVYQRLMLGVDPAVHFISGIITTHYVAKEDMETITFDLAGQLTVSAVTRNGNSLAFEQNEDNELVITLPAIQHEGVLDSVSVAYSGPPAVGEDAFVSAQHDGTPVLWTLSEPYGAKDWWPCKQDLTDKIDSLDVYITAPAAYTAVSNGVEQSQVTNLFGMKTTHFRHQYPIPAYLVAIAVTNYAIFTQQAGTAPDTFPIVNYIYPEDLAAVQPQLAVTPPIMALFEELFEPYPFREEKYGHAQADIGGGMEHTTVSFMSSFGRELIAHELAHQWFGDKITCGSWKDIWLNEGFATYVAALVVEHMDGQESFTNWRASKINDITSLPGGSVYLTDIDTTSVGRIFSSRLSYNKGAMVLHMLHFKLGENNFYQAVKNYLADPALAYSFAKTSDLQAHFEAVSGLDLAEFFNDWIYGQGFPTYTVTAEDLGGGQARITISQEQSHPSVGFFEMPVPVRLTGAGGEVHNVVLENTSNGQQFIVDVPFAVTGAQFDPDRHIIAGNHVLGLPEANLASRVWLYPNPSSGEVNVHLPENVVLQKAVIYNALGQKVTEYTGTRAFDVSGLASGTYHIEISTDAGTTELKFIKK